MSKDRKTIIILLLIVAFMIIAPVFALKGAKFGGSDDAGSAVVEEINPDYEVNAAPILEQLLGGELPGELESLLFCVQTGIGVGVLAFFMGRFVERKKHEEAKG